MAYLGLGVDAPFKPLAEVRLPAAHGLTAEERRLVQSLAAPVKGRLPRTRRCPKLVQDLVWEDPPREPAALRHDALRRYAVAYRTRDARLRRCEADAIKAGLLNADLAEIRDLVGPVHAPRRGRASVLFIYGLLILDVLLGVACTIEWLSPRLGSLAIAFILSVVLLISFAPLLAEPHPARRQS